MLKPTHLVHTVGNGLDAVIVGRLAETVTTRDDTSRARLDVSHIRTEPDTPFSAIEGSVLLRVKGKWPDDIRPGDQVMVRTSLQPPPIANTPGTFNYREFLAHDDVYVTGTVDHPILISAFSQSETPFPERLILNIEGIRADIGNVIDSALSSPVSSIYKALLIGDRTGIPPAIMDVFKKTGTMHLLAVSGMHTGFLAAALYLVINWTLRRSTLLVLNCDVRKLSLLATVPPILFYALLTGAQAPVVRSLIMLGVFVTAFTINRLHRPLCALTAAAFAILLYNPTALFSVSFQLSFVAVAAIVVGLPRLLSALNVSPESFHTGNFISRILCIFFTIGAVTIVATIGTVPLMLHHFNFISPFTLPANLLIQPLICFWSLPLGIVSIFVCWFSPDLATVTFQAGALGIKSTLWIGTFFADSSFSQIWLPGPSIAICIVYYSGLILLIADLPLKIRLSCTVPFLLFSVISMFHLSAIRPGTTQEGWSISVLDIGHGSANVIEMNNGHIVLVDGGAKTSPGYNCGERTIAPFLWHRNIARVNDIIITHDDADHYNGIPAIIERFRPQRLFLPSVESPKSGLRMVMEYADRYGVDIVTLEHDTEISQNGETLQIILAAGKSVDWRRGSTTPAEDDSGLIARFEAGNFSMLFPGDISKRKEHDLVESGRILESTVLLSAHHGSSTSNSYRFFEAVSPEYLIFSAGGRDNPLFPSQQALKNAGLLGIKTLRTALDGSVLISYDHSTGYRVDTYNRSTRRYYRNASDMPDTLHLGKVGRRLFEEFEEF